MLKPLFSNAEINRREQLDRACHDSKASERALARVCSRLETSQTCVESVSNLA